MVMKAGMASVSSEKSIFKMGSIIRKPTTMRAGAVAAEGTTSAKGQRNSESKNSMPVTNAVAPVFPPSAIPAADST